MTRKIEVDEQALVEEMGRIGEISDRVRLAGFGLAQPLLRMRRGQLEREVVRVTSRKGADHPDVAEARAALTRATRKIGEYDGELGRARIDRTPPSGEAKAGISGRVVRSGLPAAGLTVTAWAGSERADFACTDSRGGFALEVPTGQRIVLSVRSDAGTVLYRDAVAETLASGQQRFREIDLDRTAAPCPEPDDGPTPEPDRFKLVSIVGQSEGDALALLRAQGLQPGEITREPSAKEPGRVLAQKPKAGTMVRRGDQVALVVGGSEVTAVPDLVGLRVQAVAEVLKRARLQLGEARAVDVPGAKEGMVSGQKPAAGSKATEGDRVDVEFGRQQGSGPSSPSVVRVATLAEERLRSQGVLSDEPAGHIENRLAGAGVVDDDTLADLLGQDPKIVKERLGLRTLADTSKVLAAIRRARKDLH